ncbi:MAG: hypothetical protein H7Y15_18360, partial [Pseudonocardia sp.]|nr:hypothetical protein [Pseudonocardia sp.]
MPGGFSGTSLSTADAPAVRTSAYDTLRNALADLAADTRLPGLTFTAADATMVRADLGLVGTLSVIPVGGAPWTTTVRVGPSPVGGSPDAAASWTTQAPGAPTTYAITLSDRLTPADVQRAITHEVAEIAQQHGRPPLDDRPGTGRPQDKLGPGNRGRTRPETLSPHDHGRLAELRLLTRQLAAADPAERARPLRELTALVDHLGLREGTPGAEARRGVLDTEVSPEVVVAVAQLGVPVDQLPAEARDAYDAVMTAARAAFSLEAMTDRVRARNPDAVAAIPTVLNGSTDPVEIARVNKVPPYDMEALADEILYRHASREDAALLSRRTAESAALRAVLAADPAIRALVDRYLAGGRPVGPETAGDVKSRLSVELRVRQLTGQFPGHRVLSDVMVHEIVGGRRVNRGDIDVLVIGPAGNVVHHEEVKSGAPRAERSHARAQTERHGRLLAGVSGNPIALEVDGVDITGTVTLPPSPSVPARTAGPVGTELGPSRRDGYDTTFGL